MYARHVSFNLKAIKREEVTQIFETEILPLLQKQNGFTDRSRSSAQRASRR